MTSVPATLEGEVAGCLGLAAVRLEPAAGGASHLAFEVHDDTRPGPPVAFLRSEGPGGSLSGSRYGLAREAVLLPVAAGLGFPVPRVLGTPGTPPGLLMEVVAGTSRPGPADLEGADSGASRYLALVARLHAADPSAFPVEQFATVGAALADDLAYWHDLSRRSGADDDLIVRVAHRVLAATLPVLPGLDQPPVLVHGDIGPGNFMVDAGAVTAMLDWELAHAGDAHEDLAWLWMRGAHTDFGEPRQRLAEYEAAAGSQLNPDRLRWHLALVMWKSVVAIHGTYRNPTTDAGTLVQVVVGLTYDALLGSQLARLLGGSLPLLGAKPERRASAQAQLADRLVAAGGLGREGTIIAEHLGEVAAQAAWEQAEHERDARSLLGRSAADLVDHAATAPDDDLQALALVAGRAADRAALAMPKAVRRIERAQRIGLGTAIDPTRRM